MRLLGEFHYPLILRFSFGIMPVKKSALTEVNYQKRRCKGELNCQFNSSAETNNWNLFSRWIIHDTCHHKHSEKKGQTVTHICSRLLLCVHVGTTFSRFLLMFENTMNIRTCVHHCSCRLGKSPRIQQFHFQPFIIRVFFLLIRRQEYKLETNTWQNILLTSKSQ